VRQTGFPDYKLKNNSANIRRIRRRIEALSKRPEPRIASVRSRGAVSRRCEQPAVPGVSGKPEEAVRKRLRVHGCILSRSRGPGCAAEQRGALCAQCVLDALPAE